jgi:hypothetical protein
VENGIFYSLALKNADVPFELHVYPTGGHGYGLRPTKHLVMTWPQRAAEWMRSRDLLKPKCFQRLQESWRRLHPSDENGKALLLPEAVGPNGSRSPHCPPTGKGKEFGDPDGQPRQRRTRSAAGGRGHSSRRDWRATGSACLVKSTDLATRAWIGQ